MSDKDIQEKITKKIAVTGAVAVVAAICPPAAAAAKTAGVIVDIFT